MFLILSKRKDELPIGGVHLSLHKPNIIIFLEKAYSFFFKLE